MRPRDLQVRTWDLSVEEADETLYWLEIIREEAVLKEDSVSV